MFGYKAPYSDEYKAPNHFTLDDGSAMVYPSISIFTQKELVLGQFGDDGGGEHYQQRSLRTDAIHIVL